MTSYRTMVLGIIVIAAALTFIEPPFPNEILLQHIPTALAVGMLAFAHRYIRMSERSFTLIALFLALHIVGARWIYSFVPYDDWTTSLFGWQLSAIMGWERNHYDRFVHFAYGILFAYPIREFCLRHVGVSARFAGYIALEFTMATSMVYELIEWGIAITLAPDAAERYNGQQGDMWDAHKDMALATVGAIITIAISSVGTERRGTPVNSTDTNELNR